MHKRSRHGEGVDGENLSQLKQLYRVIFCIICVYIGVEDLVYNALIEYAEDKYLREVFI